jgi:hypothetical protein
MLSYILMIFEMNNKNTNKNQHQRIFEKTSTKRKARKHNCNNHIDINNLHHNKKNFIKLFSLYIVKKTPAALRVEDLSATADAYC